MMLTEGGNMELGKFVPNPVERFRAIQEKRIQKRRHEQVEVIGAAQKGSLLSFAEQMWGPQHADDGTENWQTFTDVKGFDICFGITNGSDYFVPYPAHRLDLDLDWQGYIAPMCRLYVEKNGTDDEITGIGGHSGPLFTVEEVGTGIEWHSRVVYWENPIYDPTVDSIKSTSA